MTAAKMPRFHDRREAGRWLAEALDDIRGQNCVVLGIPRGGVVVAHAVAPVASWEGARLVAGYCDESVFEGVADRGLFFAVSLYYDDFPQVTDEEVVSFLG